MAHQYQPPGEVDLVSHLAQDHDEVSMDFINASDRNDVTFLDELHQHHHGLRPEAP